MYPPISLYPGGAVMLCEDVSEYDENLPLPVRPEDPPDEPVQVANSVTPEPVPCVPHRLRKFEDLEPTRMVFRMLEPTYRERIVPMLATTYEYQDREQAIALLNDLAEAASEIVTTVRCALVKSFVIAETFDENDARASVETHMGFFLRHSAEIARSTSGSRIHTHRRLEPVFWPNAARVTDAMLGDPCMENIVDGSVIQLRVGEHPLATAFDGFEDFLRCVFEDMDRRARMEVEIAETLRIDELMKPTDCCGTNRLVINKIRPTIAALLREASLILRNVSRMCYDWTTDLIYGDPDHAIFGDRARRAMCQLTNIFALGTIMSMACADVVEELIGRAEAINDYVGELVDFFGKR